MNHPLRRSLILVVRALDIFLICIWVVAVLAGVVSFFANLTLIQSLRDLYPKAYVQAGSPRLAALFLSIDINFKWLNYLLRGRFRSDPLTPPQLKELMCLHIGLGGFMPYLSLASFFS